MISAQTCGSTVLTVTKRVVSGMRALGLPAAGLRSVIWLTPGKFHASNAELTIIKLKQSDMYHI
jgi:hypothetical protein